MSTKFNDRGEFERKWNNSQNGPQSWENNPYGVGPPIPDQQEKKSSIFKMPSWFGSSKPQQENCKKTCEQNFPNSGGRKSKSRRKNKKNKRKSLRRKK
jgi:hypothetical protein